MPIPIVLTYADGHADTIRVEDVERVQRFTIPLPEEPKDLLFDPEEWILKKIRTIQGPSGIDAGAEDAAAANGWELRVVPNPSPGPTHLFLRPIGGAGRGESDPGPGREIAIRILDVTGRVVRTLRMPSPEAVDSATEWDGRRVDGLPAEWPLLVRARRRSEDRAGPPHAHAMSAGSGAGASGPAPIQRVTGRPDSPGDRSTPPASPVPS